MSRAVARSRSLPGTTARSSTLALPFALATLFAASLAHAQLDGGVLDASVEASVEASGDPLDASVPLDGDLADASVDAGEPDAGAPDAGAPDAGAPDAGPPPTASERAPDTYLPEWLYALIFERAEQAERAAQRAADAQQTGASSRDEANDDAVQVRMVGCDATPAVLGLTLPERAIATPVLFVMWLAFIAVAFALYRLKRTLPDRGLLPRFVRTLELLARITVVVVAVMLAARLLPGWLRPALILSVAAAAIAVGAGAVWMVLPDIVSGLLLVAEARVRPGLFITADEFAGTVEEVGPRVTTLVDAEGHKLTVPNRLLVKSAVHSVDRRWPELHLSLRVPTDRQAAQVRRAVEDAVLCSPQLPPQPELAVARDPADPHVWRIRVRLLDVTHREAFEGQLLERIEEALEAGRPHGPE
ncbi:MAG: mechanosensitive ion channel domain-containing protein [Sandaracinaceae bacterium]